MDHTEYIEMLSDKQSSKRRSAAKKLGKHGDPSSGPALLASLKREIQDPRTWETQCSLIRALADTGFRESISYLWELCVQDFEHTLIYTELGTSICRLQPIENSDLSAVFRLSESEKIELGRGAFRAIFFLRIVPSSAEDITRILAIASKDRTNEGQMITGRCYIAAAAAAWDHPEVPSFLRSCQNSIWPFLRQVAEDSLSGIYPKWKPW